jgi:hypothetical protein
VRMKSVRIILSLMLVLILTGTAEKVKALTKIMQLAQNQNVVNHAHVYAVLFEIADIKLKDKSSLTGRLTVFDPKNKTINIVLSGVDSRSVPIYQIQQITFRPYDDLLEESRRVNVHRGGSKITLTGIPLDDFVLLDGQKGQASVDLTKMVNETQKNPIPPLEPDEVLYVEEMQFDSTGKMTIKVMLTKFQMNGGE